MIVTIDGPSGTGKTTIAKAVAEKLHMTYFDTGAMYRAVTLGLLSNNIALDDLPSIEKYLETFKFDIDFEDDEKHYFVNGEDVTREIRTQKVTTAVSQVSAIARVREALLEIQRAYGETKGAVFEGRDLGSVVFSKARVKIFLDASPKVRAKRRLSEMLEKHPEDAKKFDLTQMEEELERRDTYDSSRKHAPLKCPKDALRIDTSELTVEEIVKKIIDYYRKKARKLYPSWLHSRRMNLLYRFVLCITWFFFRIFYRHKVYGLEHYVQRASIIAPNHTSYYDPPIASLSWPDEVHFLAKEGLFKPFLFGSFIRALNSHPVQGDVGDISVFKTIIKLLKEGKPLILFPEGKRTDGEIGEIKPGIGMLLMRSKAAIIPTYIYGASKVYGKNRKFPKLFGGKTACVFGTPILWESFAHLEKREAQELIAKTLSDALHDLKNWYESGAKGTPP